MAEASGPPPSPFSSFAKFSWPLREYDTYEDPEEYGKPWEEDQEWHSYSSQEKEEKLKNNITELEKGTTHWQSELTQSEESKILLKLRLRTVSFKVRSNVEEDLDDVKQYIKLCKQRIKQWQKLLSANEQQLGHEHQTAENAIKEGVIEVQQMNIALLGAGGAGKTSVLSALVGKKPPPQYTSTDVYSCATRVASIETPSDFIRSVTTNNRVLVPSDSLTPDCFTWLVGNNLLHLTASGANADLEEVRRRVAVSHLGKRPAKTLTFKSSTRRHSQVHNGNKDAAYGAGSSTLEAKPCIDYNRIHTVAKDVLSQATELMKLPTTEPLAKVRIINFIDSGGQLQFSEIFRAFNSNINGGIFVFDATKDLKENIYDQFFVNGKPVGNPYKSQCTRELLFKRSLQALQQSEKSPCMSVVVTHPDQVKTSNLPSRIREIDEWIQSILETTDLKDDMIFNESLRDILFVLRADNPSDEDLTRVRKLLQRICDMFSNKSLVQVHRIPLQQFLLEQAMRQLGEGKNGLLSIEECREVACAIIMPSESVDKALRYLRSCNLILYFPELESLKEVVFCEVQTLLSIITQLVQYSTKLRGGSQLDSIPTPNVVSGKCSTDFATQGIISEELLAMDTFASCFNDYFTGTQFIELMDYLEIVGLVNAISHQYIMPCILPEMSYNEVKKYRMVSESVSPLLLYFGKWPQSGIFCSLIARLGSLYQWKPLPFCEVNPPCLYRNCMKLKPPSLPCTITLIESYNCGYFEVHVRPSSEIDLKAICPEVKRILREALHKTAPKDSFVCENELCHTSANQHMHAATVEIVGPEVSGFGRAGRYLSCSLTGEVSPLSARHHYWFEVADISIQAITPDDIAALLELLVELAGRWELFLGQLGVSKSVIDQLKRDNAHKPDFSKHCLQSGLHCWVISDDLPTYSKISAVLRGAVVTNKPLARKVDRLAGCAPGRCSHAENLSSSSRRPRCSLL